MRFIDAETIRSVLTLPLLVAAIEAAHRRSKIEVADAHMGSEDARYFVRHAVDAGRFMASKLITSFPANLEHGTCPAVQAVLVMFDGRDGRPLATMDGTEVTWWRTAADSALGARYLASPEPRTLLVIGAGAMSHWLVRAHTTARPTITRILVWNRTRQRAAALATRLAGDGFTAEAIDDLATGIARADVVSSATRSQVPLIEGGLLRPGQHVDLVGGYSAATREADDEAMRRGRVFVDRRETAFAGVGDILAPIRSGALREADVVGDLYDLVAGTVAGRRSADDITVFKNAGGAHLDLMTAEAVIERLGII